MRYCDWDEVLDRDGLLILTEEALTPPRRSRAPMRRLAAAAACAGLVLGLMNYRAVAAGVGELCRYFAGIGATADDKAELWVLEEPVTWTEGDWTYEADATLRSGVLELELTMSSRLPADQLPSPVKLRLGLSADGEPLHNAVHTITPYSVADAGEGSGYPRYRLEQDYQTTASTRLRCTMAAPPPEDCSLHVSGLGVQGGVFSLRLVPAETPPTVQKTWTLPQGDMTIWVAEDGSAISASFDSTEWWGWPFDISFIGASGERYPCHDITGAYELDGTERFEAIKPEGMEEPVDAVCIGGVAVERIRMPAAGPTTCMKVSTGLSSCPEPRKNVPGGNSLRGRFWIRDRQGLTGGVPWRPPAVPRPAAAWHTRRAGTGHAPTVPFYSKSSGRCTRRRRRPPRTGRSPARAGRRPGRGWAGEEGPAGRAKAGPCRRRRRG